MEGAPTRGGGRRKAVPSKAPSRANGGSSTNGQPAAATAPSSQRPINVSLLLKALIREASRSSSIDNLRFPSPTPSPSPGGSSHAAPVSTTLLKVRRQRDQLPVVLDAANLGRGKRSVSVASNHGGDGVGGYDRHQSPDLVASSAGMTFSHSSGGGGPGRGRKRKATPLLGVSTNAPPFHLTVTSGDEDGLGGGGGPTSKKLKRSLSIEPNTWSTARGPRAKQLSSPVLGNGEPSSSSSSYYSRSMTRAASAGPSSAAAPHYQQHLLSSSDEHMPSPLSQSFHFLANASSRNNKNTEGAEAKVNLFERAGTTPSSLSDGSGASPGGTVLGDEEDEDEEEPEADIVVQPATTAVAAA